MKNQVMIRLVIKLVIAGLLTRIWPADERGSIFNPRSRAGVHRDRCFRFASVYV